MPNFEPVVAEGRSYQLRLIGPKGVVYATAPGESFTVLARSDMVARPLPQSSNPNSPDMVSGSWTGRINDAGEFQLTFPNKEASDGVPWRNRFDPTGHLQWIEIYNDGYLEMVGCITKLDLKRDQIQVSGYDGFYLLKNAYERDWIVTQAPRDTVERGTQVWVPTTTDNFPAGSLSSQWTPQTTFGGSVSVSPSGSLRLAATSSVGSSAVVFTAPVAVSSTGAWVAHCGLNWADLGSGPFLALRVIEDSGPSAGSVYCLELFQGLAQLLIGSNGINSTVTPVGQVQLSSVPQYDLTIESDGEWVRGFVNGQLVSCVRRSVATATSLQVQVSVVEGGGVASVAAVKDVLLESLQPFLM